MAVNYSPIKHTGAHASTIFSEIVESNGTVANGYITFYDNVKDEVNLTSSSGTPAFKAYKENIRESDLGDYTTTLTFADKTLTPKKMQSIILFEMDKLRPTRFGASMAAGAANIVSSEFDAAARAHLTPLYARAFEDKIWTGCTEATQDAIAGSVATASQESYIAALSLGADDVVDGLLPSLIVANPIDLAGTTLTTSNIKTEIDKVLALVPSAVLKSPDFRLYVPFSMQFMIDVFNASQTYRGDIFRVNGDVYTYLGKRLCFVPLPENCMIAGIGSEFGAATDLLADSVAFEVEKVNNIGDQMFGKLTCALATGVVVPTQKVLYL